MERAKKAGKPKTAEECCLACNDAPLDSFTPMTKRYVLLIRQYKLLYPNNPIKNCRLTVRDVSEKIQSKGGKTPEIDAAVNLLGILENGEITDPEETFAWLSQQGLDLGESDFILTVGADTMSDIGGMPTLQDNNELDTTRTALDHMTLVARQYKQDLEDTQVKLRDQARAADGIRTPVSTRTVVGNRLASGNEALPTRP